MKKINLQTATKNLKKNFPVHEKSEIIANLKRNWFFPISAAAFFCLYATLDLVSIAGVLIVFLAMLVISTQISSILKYCSSCNILVNSISLLSAIGVCLVGRGVFCLYWGTATKIQYIGTFGAVAATFFVYFCILAMWKNMVTIAKDVGTFRGIKMYEWIAYGLLLVASIVFMVFSFSSTEAFYGTEYPYDIIYTSDSPLLVKDNAYLILTHPENDIRQPLFAVFAAPFAGFPYLIARVIGASATVQAILINSVQIIMMLAANYLLAKMLKLDSKKRICFMVLASCTYTQLLFTLMMEQYIVAYFWLIFCIYLIAEKQQPDRMALWGAGGTLLTSMVLLPLMSGKSPVKEFKAWIVDMVKYALEFVALIVVCCRYDVILNLTSGIDKLSTFTGETVTFVDKIYQYTEFIHNCFAAPNAGINTTAYDYISWQQNAVTGISFVGIFILLLAVVSAIWNRDKKSSLLAAGWIGFSAVILLALGWGTTENGLILYSLYFGWAFLVLLVQLVEKIENKLNIKYLLPIVTACVTIALLVINIPAIMEMVVFAITHYPV